MMLDPLALGWVSGGLAEDAASITPVSHLWSSRSFWAKLALSLPDYSMRRSLMPLLLWYGRDVPVWRVVLWCGAQFSIAVLDYLWLKGSEQQNMLTCFLQNSCNTFFFFQVDDASVLQCLFLLKQERLGRTDCSEDCLRESLYPPSSYFMQFHVDSMSVFSSLGQFKSTKIPFSNVISTLCV